MNKNEIKKLKYSNEWDKGLDKNLIGKLEALQGCIINIFEPVKEWEERDIEAGRLWQYFKKSKSIKEIIFHGNQIVNGKPATNSFPIKNPKLIGYILTSLIDERGAFKLPTKKPKEGKPEDNLKRLFNSGGYEVILDLKKNGFSDKYLFDFIQLSVTKSDGSYKIETKNLQAFKTALSDFKKSK